MSDQPIAGRPGTVPTAGTVAALIERCATASPDTALESQLRRLASARGAADRSAAPLGRLCFDFGLTAFERDLLVLAGLPEEHESLALLARTLHPLGEPRLSFASAATILELDATGRHHLRVALEGGTLRHTGLVTGPESVPLPERGLRLLGGLWSVLCGVDHWPEELRLAAVPAMGDSAPGADWLDGVVAGGASVVLVSSGPPAQGQARSAFELASLVAAALQRRGRPWVCVEASQLDGGRDTLISAHTIARGAVPIVIGAPALPALAAHPRPVVICAETVTGVALDERPVAYLELDRRLLGESVEMWADLAPELNGGGAELAGLLRFDHLRAHLAVTDARAAATLRGRAMTVADVVGTARYRTDTSLPGSVRLVSPDALWDDLVVTGDQEELLRSVVARVAGQVRVLHDWGFAQARGTRGVRVLLTGSPGTGKTLSAEVIAADLGLDLLVVDLSALVSKWLGETEKNIAAVFDAAERCQAVLFFDEADAVFGRRTDGSDAQARWANLETAYLLGRVDRFDGLVLLATNLRSNIDDAFVRRLDVVVEFGEPDLGERMRLWQLHLPATAPIAADVDIHELATLYPVTGGLIRNAAIAAAFGAASRGDEIDQGALVTAMRHEYQKAGRSFPGAPRVRATARGGADDGPELA
jgi:hypothetical protein